MKNNPLFSEIVLIFFLICTSLLFRVPFLSTIPSGSHWDESAYAYNAYTLLTTGKDEWGSAWPLFLRSFNDYKGSLLSLLLIPGFALFSPSVLVARLTVVLLSSISSVVLYLLIKKLTGSKLTAFVAALLYTVSPLQVQYSRVIGEQVPSLLFLMLGIYGLIQSKKVGHVLGSVSLALSMHAYHSARLVVPLLIICLLVTYAKPQVRLFIRERAVGLGIITVSVLFFLLQTTIGSGGTRARQIFILNQPFAVNAVNEGIYRSMLTLKDPVRTLNNKLVVVGYETVRKYLLHFQSDFLFFNNNLSPRHAFSKHGNLLLVMLPLLVLGFVQLFKSGSHTDTFFLLWLLVGPLPAALTTDVPHSGRFMLTLPALCYVAAMGVVALLRFKHQLLNPRVVAVSIALLLSYNVALYAKDYYLFFPEESENAFLGHLEEVSRYVYGVRHQYDTVYFDDDLSSHYIFMAWYNLADPNLLTHTPSTIDNIRFVSVGGDLNCMLAKDNVLVVVPNYNKDLTSLKQFYYHNRYEKPETAFYLYESRIIPDEERKILFAQCKNKSI